MTKLQQLHELGQSTWLNYMRRSFIQSGELRDCLADGIQGVTANAAVFEDTIANHDDYDKDIQKEVRAGTPTTRIHEALMVDDVQRAADLLHPIFEMSNGVDGFASLEMDPAILSEPTYTVATARRLLNKIDRGNAMVEIPSSLAGVEAIKALTLDGVSINATHIFSISVFERVAQAYIAGLETYFDTHSIWRKAPTAVASFSVAAIDDVVDKELKLKKRPDLCGQTGIAMARLLYLRFQEIFSGPRWQKLVSRGANALRPKWTRISTYSAEYPDTFYVDQLIGADSVITFTPRTLDAFLQQGTAAYTIDKNLEHAAALMKTIADIGIDLEGKADQMQLDHLETSDKQFQLLIQSVIRKLYAEAAIAN